MNLTFSANPLVNALVRALIGAVVTAGVTYSGLVQQDDLSTNQTIGITASTFFSYLALRFGVEGMIDQKNPDQRAADTTKA